LRAIGIYPSGAAKRAAVANASTPFRGYGGKHSLPQSDHRESTIDPSGSRLKQVLVLEIV